MYDTNAAVEHITREAESGSIGRCAEYTRKAVEAGGIILSRSARAKDYGASLEMARFNVVDDGTLEAGDLVVIDGFKGSPSGHMAMYDGTRWISDFVQRELYPGPSYRNAKPTYRIYRYGGNLWNSISTPGAHANYA